MFYTLWRHARLQVDSIGLPTLNVCIVSYLFGSMPRYTLIPLGCPYRTFLLCFTGLGAMPGSSLTPLDCPHRTFLLCFTTHCSSNIKALFPPLVALQFEELHLTFLVTSQAGPSPRTFRVLRNSKPVPRPLRGHREGLRKTVRLSVALLFHML